jgi:hypothetical protein
MKFLWLSGAFLCVFLHIASPQGPISDLDAQRSDVVLIRAAATGGTFETAAGLFVGRDMQNAYFVTALHPFVPDGAIDPIDHVKVQFVDAAASYDGSILANYSPSKDLAVIVLPIAYLPVDLPKMAWKDPTPELPIHVIGHPPAATWTSWTGMVQNESNYAGEPEWFTTSSDPSLTKGYSGGPVFDSKGNFIGIHLAGSSSTAKNLKSSVIVSSLSAWHVPVTNLSSEDPDTARFKIAQDIVSNFRQDDISSVISHFNSTLNDQASIQGIRFPWTRATGFLGDYQSIAKQEKRIVGPYSVYVTKMKFENGNLELRLTFDSKNAVGGIWLITVGDHKPSELEAKATSTVSKLANKQFQDVFDSYVASIRAGNTPDTIAMPWNSLIAAKGSYINQISAVKSTEADYVDVRCKFENGDFIVRVSLAPSLELMGIDYLPAL